MKLSELRVCDGCGGPLVRPPQIQFFVVRTTAAIVIPSAANEVLGLTQYFQGALKLAETMAPDPEVVKLLGDQPGASWDELFLCFDCYCAKSAAVLVEGAQARLNEAPSKGETIQ